MRKLLLGLALLVGFSCTSKKKSSEKEFMASLDTLQVLSPSVSEEAIAEIMEQIPSPLEVSLLLKETGVKYNNELLNNPQKISKYNSSYKKALNLGIYGTDLGYSNIYEENQDAIEYLGSIKKLADEMSIGQFFDFETIKGLATNSKNLDELLTVTTENFNNINQYLREQNRSSQSVLFLTGGWIEAVNILCQIEKQVDAKELYVEKIGEQKIILENISKLLNFYQNSDPNIVELKTAFASLEKAFENVKINYTYVEPVISEGDDGQVLIQDNSTTEVVISPKDIVNIRASVEEVRNQIIQ
ncbi:MAG: hypothetical protein MI784_13040 [Cytophagales bacterium]|nr:hypothetical protein [Cytophagales bacterium]